METSISLGSILVTIWHLSFKVCMYSSPLWSVSYQRADHVGTTYCGWYSYWLQPKLVYPECMFFVLFCWTPTRVLVQIVKSGLKFEQLLTITLGKVLLHFVLLVQDWAFSGTATWKNECCGWTQLLVSSYIERLFIYLFLIHVLDLHNMMLG